MQRVARCAALRGGPGGTGAYAPRAQLPLLIPLLLILLCAPAFTLAAGLFSIEFFTLLESGGTRGSDAVKATANLASVTYVDSTTGTWTPTTPPSGQLNVYVTTASDGSLLQMASKTPSNQYVLVAFTSEGAVDTRMSGNNIFFVNADPATEMLALLSYIVPFKVPAKIGFLYSSSFPSGPRSVGSAVLIEFTKRISQLNYGGEVITLDLATSVSADLAGFFTSLSTNSAIFLFIPPSMANASILNSAFNRGASNYVLAPSWLMYTVTAAFSVSPATMMMTGANVIVSSTNPHPQDKNYKESMKQFSNDCSSLITDLAPSSADGVEYVAGWLAAQATLASLQPFTLWNAAPQQTDYTTGLFQSRTFTVGTEILLGATSTTCNVGGRMVLLYSLSPSTLANGTTYNTLNSVSNGALLLKPSECHAASVVLNMWTKVQVGFSQFNGATEGATYLSTQAREVGQNMRTTFNSLIVDGVDGMSCSGWQSKVSGSPGVAFVGPAFGGMDVCAVSKMLVDPLFLTTTLYQNFSNVVYVTSTHEQQWGAMATWAKGQTPPVNVYAVVRDAGATAAAMAETAQRIWAHAGVPIKSVKTLTSGEALSSSDLPSSGLILLAGMMKSDIDTMGTHLGANPGAKVVLLLDDMTQFYSSIRSTYGSSAYSDRVLFATNLPPWVTKTTETAFSKNFFASVPGPDFYAPAAMRTYLAARVLDVISSQALSPTLQGLFDSLYAQQVLVVDGLVLAPYQLNRCVYSTSDNQLQCAGFLNGGAVDTNVWTLGDMLNGADGGPLAGPYSIDLFGYARGVEISDSSSSSSSSSTVVPEPPTTTQQPKPPSNSSTATIIAVIVVCAVVVAAVAAAVVFCIFCSGDSRDNRNAPKDANEPVTLMFTDIESSTALWATAPQAMASAVALHHKVARQLIVKYKCYEVKTIGDSFMIACTQPFAAVQLAYDLQMEFHQAEWGSTAIDDAYATIGKLGGGTNPDECKTNPWSGLRVRVGIHRGLAEVRLDEVTKGYDYYGDTVNTAARTESIGCGGQVICTASVVDALAEEERATVQLLPLGPHQLRGVAAPIEMFELRTVPGRVFPSKATGVAANPLATLGAGVDGNCAPDAGELNPMMLPEESQAETTAANVEPVTEVLDVYFSAYSSQQKIKLLRKTCKYFCLPNPPRRMFASDEAYLQSLMLAVATRTSAVIDFRHKQQEGSLIGSAAEVENNEQTLDEANDHDAAAESRRHSGVFFSGIDSPKAGESKRRRSLMIGRSGPRRPSHESTASTMVLVLDNGELLTLCSGGGRSRTEEPVKEVREAAAVYLNGAPSVIGDEVSACFEEGNGLLFRVIDKAAKRWAFYNDTKDFIMHVHFSVGRSSVVEWGPGIVGKVTQVESTGRYEGELLVAPLATEVLMTGRVNGYSMRYSATLPEDGE
ncbi:receptor-type adenylate cyclase a-like protein [Novymonas esmeraldas]|uniref:adenylate cyclase n=1 Tax=Novymonas esmeraldas TaxID=1808958 RepID=A0AAW0ER06_9TRYP